MFNYPVSSIKVYLQICYQNRLIDYCSTRKGILPLYLSPIKITSIGELAIDKLLINMQYYEETIQNSVIPNTLRKYFKQTFASRRQGVMESVGDDKFKYLTRYYYSRDKFVTLIDVMNIVERKIFMLFANSNYSSEHKDLIYYFINECFNISDEISAKYEKELQKNIKFFSKKTNNNYIKLAKFLEKDVRKLKFKCDD